jgi:hypothetical protein
MSKYLPYGGYEWVNEIEKFNKEYILSLEDEADKGYILDVDLDVPENLHDYFNDYPLAVENCEGELSPLMKSMYNVINDVKEEDINDSLYKSTTSKLIPNLRNKTNYVVHYQNLKLYIKLGLVLKKVNRVLKFDQKPYLKEYIEFNSRQRAITKNDYEKSLFKLMNNAIYGKTMENVAKRIEVKLISDPKKFVYQTSKPHYKDFRIFSDGLCAVEMSKTKIVYNRPIIAGFSILELSKVHMYNFHYNNIIKKYGADKCKLLFTDTDSLCYHIQTNDIYEDMKENLTDYDMSDYPKNNICYDETNKKV